MLGSVCAADADIANDQENTVAVADTTLADDTVSEVVSSEEMSECYSADYFYSQGEIATSGEDIASSNKDNASSDVLGASNENEVLSEDNNVKTIEFDGEIHSSVEINNAINDGYTTLYLGGNLFQHKGTINLKSNIIIDGQGATIYGTVSRQSMISGSAVDNVTIKNINFCNSTSGYTGGGSAIALLYKTVNNVRVPVTNIIIDNCTFNSLSGVGKGAGVWIGSYSPLGMWSEGTIPKSDNISIVNCDFKKCCVSTSGGAINFDGGYHIHSYVINCTFDECTCNLNGGAIEFYTSYSVIDNCNFTNNTSLAPYTKYRDDGCVGGAIVLFSNSQYVNITNSRFVGNSVRDNKVVMTCSGGAIGLYHTTNINMLVENCSFINNTANEGGAVYYNAANSYMRNCEFTGNIARNVDGGAICSHAAGSVVETCNFTNNTAPIGMDFYAHEGCEITFIGLSFQALWLTNDGNIKVTSGHGTSWDNPASWDYENQCLEFLNTNSGKTTIYHPMNFLWEFFTLL